MLPNRFHRKERHVITNQLSVKKRSYKWLHEVLIVKHLHVLFHVIKRRMEVLTDAFSGQKLDSTVSIHLRFLAKKTTHLTIKSEQ